MSLYALQNVYLSNDFRVYFSDSNPQLSAFDRFENKFTSHDSVAFILHIPDQSWLSSRYLNWLQTRTEEAWYVDTVSRVSSLSNYQYSYSENDTLFTDYFYRYGGQPEDWRKAIEDDPQLTESYLSYDESVAVIQLDLSFDKNDNATIRKIHQQVLDLKENWLIQWQSKFPDQTLEIHLVGSVISNITLETAVRDDLFTLVPITYLIIALGLLIFIKSVKATVITLVIVTLSIVFTFSIFALFKQELTPIAGFVPSVILTLAVADCVHYLSSYRYLIVHQGLSTAEANREAFAINFRPIFTTSITTAIGVLFLNLSDSPPYQDLGNMVAIGVLLAFWLSVTLLPYLLQRFPIEYKSRQTPSTDKLQTYKLFLLRYPKRLAFIIILLCLTASLGINKLVISENWSRYFSEKFEVAAAIALLKQKFERLHRYEIVMEDIESQSVNAPRYLAALDHLLFWLERQGNVQHIQSYGYVLKRVNQNMNAGNTAFFSMPQSRELAAQYLLIYELSLPEGLGLETFVTYDRSASRTSILLSPMDSQALLEFERRLFDEMSAFNNVKVEVSGLDNIFAHIAHRNIGQMIIGSLVALLVISLLISLILRSVTIGVMSIIPNVFPGIVAYGLWGFTQGYIDLALSVVICMSLGIIVDDTVHFLSKYHRARKQLEYSTEDALGYSFHIVGRALITTTVVLVAGFATLLFSPLNPTAATGALFCITLICALIIDFTLLPLALILFDRAKNPDANKDLVEKS